MLNEEPGLAVARLSSDGLTVVDKLENLKISSTSKPIDTKWHFKRGNLDYLIFSEYGGDGFYVARSSHGILGPYERNSQILILGDEFKEPNVIIENERYHLIFGSWENKNAYLVSLEWDADWPYAVNFTSLSSETAPASIPTPCPVSVTFSPTPVTRPDCPDPKCPMPVQIAVKQSTETQDEKNDFDDNVERSKYDFHVHGNVVINVYNYENNNKD